MTDLQLLDKFCEECTEFIDPKLFREIEKRSLAFIVNKLPSSVEDAKVVVRDRFANNGRYIGNPEIEQISDITSRIKILLANLNDANPAETDVTIPQLKEALTLSEFLKNYYR